MPFHNYKTSRVVILNAQAPGLSSDRRRRADERRGRIFSMRTYLDFMRHVRDHGTRKEDRTGTGTLSVFGYQMRFDLREGFPLLTTKRVHVRSVVAELLWFLQGATNVKWLHDQGVTIWDEWADDSGELGPIYGYQWRS